MGSILNALRHYQVGAPTARDGTVERPIGSRG